MTPTDGSTAPLRNSLVLRARIKATELFNITRTTLRSMHARRHTLANVAAQSADDDMENVRAGKSRSGDGGFEI
jgi:hypothetical protein